tara:strand:- start:1703 stop:2014 length:312 start_codon:yes stop_codon:yes gene_type:complete
MTIESVSTYAPVPAGTASSGFASLGQGDFFKLLTVQMQQQDPFDPVDNKEMLAQMAQFSSLAGISEMGNTLSSISSKLDALIELQMKTVETQSAEPDGTQAAL